MSVKPRRTAAERREEVIRAAITEFGMYGYHGGSTERIAREADISQPYVLRLFDTKLNLFVATLDHVCESIERTWKRALEASPATGWDGLMVLGQSYAVGEDTAMRFRMVMQGAAASGTAEIEAAINSGMDRLWAWVKSATQADDADIQRFWAYGMMQTMAISMNAQRYLDSSDRARAMILLPSH